MQLFYLQYRSLFPLDRVLHPDIYETISSTSPAKESIILGRILFTSIVSITLGTIF